MVMQSRVAILTFPISACIDPLVDSAITGFPPRVFADSPLPAPSARDPQELRLHRCSQRSTERVFVAVVSYDGILVESNRLMGDVNRLIKVQIYIFPITLAELHIFIKIIRDAILTNRRQIYSPYLQSHL